MKKWIFSLFILSGCMVGPDYETPNLNISDSWSASENTSEEVVLEWWKQFNDEKLNELIVKAAHSNYSVQAAIAKIAEARAVVQMSASKLFPQITADTNAKKYYFSKNGFLSLFDRAKLPPVIPQIDNLFNFLFDVSWELDLFGKTRRTVEAAEGYLDSQVEYKNGVLLSVLAEIANTYIDLRITQKKLNLATKALWIAEEELFIAKENKEKGLIDQTALNQRENDFLSAKSKIPDLIAKILSSIYSISVLTGDLPETLVEDLSQDTPLLTIPENVSIGLRSDLLRRRPDVRKAERELAAATASVGIAVASFFPSFSLGMDAGLQSLHLNDFLDWDSRTWNVGGDIQLPIFQGGKQVGNLRFSQALAIQAAQNYKKTVYSAIQEAESSLVEFQNKKKVLEAKKEMLQVSFDNWAISRVNFERGLTNRTQNLRAENDTLEMEKALLQTNADTLHQLTALYKALGGGWESFNTQTD